MQTLTRVDQLFCDAARKLRAEAVIGAHDPHSFVGKIVSATFENVARTYANGEYEVEFEYTPESYIDRIDVKLDAVRQALVDLLGANRTSVRLSDHHCFGGYGIVISVSLDPDI